MKTSLSRDLDCRNAALISTEANLKFSFAATAINSINESFDSVGLSDCGFTVS